MNKICLIFLTSVLVFPAPVSAHLVGQPPFFKVNGQYSNLYPVPGSSINNFNLPQDLSFSNYVVNQALDLEFDVLRLPAPKAVVDKTKFYWDYGDGSHDTGLRNTHTYTKPGSYILSINAQYLSDPQPQLIESVLINVQPTADYKMPQAVIKINGLQSHDPVNDILKFDLKNPLNFDGTSSVNGSSKIVSYFWDLGDTHSSSKASLSYQYDSQLNQIFPLLRVKDENGLFSDSYVEIENGIDSDQNIPGAGQNPLQAPGAPTSHNFRWKTLILALAIIIYLFAAILTFKRFSRSKLKR